MLDVVALLVDWVRSSPLQAAGLAAVVAAVTASILLPLGHPWSWFNFEDGDRR